jgi:hypothetical protein
MTTSIDDFGCLNALESATTWASKLHAGERSVSERVDESCELPSAAAQRRIRC